MCRTNLCAGMDGTARPLCTPSTQGGEKRGKGFNARDTAGYTMNLSGRSSHSARVARVKCTGPQQAHCRRDTVHARPLYPIEGRAPVHPCVCAVLVGFLYFRRGRLFGGRKGGRWLASLVPANRDTAVCTMNSSGQFSHNAQVARVCCTGSRRRHCTCRTVHARPLYPIEGRAPVHPCSRAGRFSRLFDGRSSHISGLLDRPT